MTTAVEVAAAFHSRFLAMLEAYLDESFNEETAIPRVSVVAGWCGEGEAWREIEQGWQSILEEVGVREFKSADCLAGQGAFNGWPQDKRDDLRHRLIATITDGRVLGVVSTIKFEQPKDIAKRTARWRLDYEVGLSYCMHTLAVAFNTYPPGERIAFIVDERAKGIQNLEAVRRRLRTDLEHGVSNRIGPAAFDNSRDVMPLQAADLLAHEAFMFRLSGCLGHDNGQRPEFTRLLARVLHVDMFSWDHKRRRLWDEAGQTYLGTDD